MLQRTRGIGPLTNVWDLVLILCDGQADIHDSFLAQII